MEEFKKVWRVDTLFFSLEEVEVYKDTPINTWLYPTWGSCGYIYLEDKDTAKEALQQVIKQKMDELQQALDELDT